MRFDDQFLYQKLVVIVNINKKFGVAGSNPTSNVVVSPWQIILHYFFYLKSLKNN
jgi:hypothetical protein